MNETEVLTPKPELVTVYDREPVSKPYGWGRWTGRLLSVLRIVAGLLFLQHGLQKILGIPMGMPPDGATAQAFTLPWIAGWLELVGGSFLVLGLFTRVVALILAGEMAVAYFMVHAPRSYWPILNGGELAALFCFVFLFFSAAGGGVWAIDALFREGRGLNSVDEDELPRRAVRTGR